MPAERITDLSERLEAYKYAKKHDKVAVVIFTWDKKAKVKASSYASHPVIAAASTAMMESMLLSFGLEQGNG